MDSHFEHAIEHAKKAGFQVATLVGDNSGFRVYSSDRSRWATITVGHSGLVRWNTPGTEFRQFDSPSVAFKELKKAWGSEYPIDFGKGGGQICSYTGAAPTGSGTCICMVCSRLRGGY